MIYYIMRSVHRKANEFFKFKIPNQIFKQGVGINLGASFFVFNNFELCTTIDHVAINCPKINDFC